LRLLAVSGEGRGRFSQRTTVDRQRRAARAGLSIRVLQFTQGPDARELRPWRDPAASERFLILLPGDLAQAVAKRLSMYVLRSKVKIADASEEMSRIGMGGPDATAAVTSVLGSAPAPFELLASGKLTCWGFPVLATSSSRRRAWVHRRGARPTKPSTRFFAVRQGHRSMSGGG
jgi:folate-binding Fe-S cluster repair protein YgfZ